MNNQGYYDSWEQTAEINSTKIKLLNLEIEQLKNQIKGLSINYTYCNSYPSQIYHQPNEIVYGESNTNKIDNESNFTNMYNTSEFNESNFTTSMYKVIPSEEINVYSEVVDSETVDNISNHISIKKLREISNLCKSTSDDLCAICKVAIKKGDIIRKLNCNHSYHPDCIDEWFDDNTNCPTCMKEFV